MRGGGLVEGLVRGLLRDCGAARGLAGDGGVVLT